MISSASRSSHSSRTPCRYSVDAGFTPPSPCTGSSSTAATRSSIAAASASRSSNATWRKPSGNGWNVSCFWGWPVAASVVSVRPWNEPYALITWNRSGPPLRWPCRRASLIAHSFASAPELQKNTRPSPPSNAFEPRRDLRLHVVVVEVRDVQQRARLVGDRVGDLGVGVPERRDREAASGSRGTPCPHCPRASFPRRARTRPAAARRSA